MTKEGKKHVPRYYERRIELEYQCILSLLQTDKFNRSNYQTKRDFALTVKRICELICDSCDDLEELEKGLSSEYGRII